MKATRRNLTEEILKCQERIAKPRQRRVENREKAKAGKMVSPTGFLGEGTACSTGHSLDYITTQKVDTLAAQNNHHWHILCPSLRGISILLSAVAPEAPRSRRYHEPVPYEVSDLNVSRAESVTLDEGVCSVTRMKGPPL